MAILTGDYLFARASEISTDLGTEVCRLLARTIAVLCDGQIREVDSSGKVDQDQDNYLGIIRRKTGVADRHLLPPGRHALGRHRRAHRGARGVRRALGMAFQLSDDIMDITSSQLELGKEPGQDLKEGVYTLPVLHALPRRSSPGGAWRAC